MKNITLLKENDLTHKISRKEKEQLMIYYFENIHSATRRDILAEDVEKKYGFDMGSSIWSLILQMHNVTSKTEIEIADNDYFFWQVLDILKKDNYKYQK
jgi:hypothetical protein